jgi:hypothetical protein
MRYLYGDSVPFPLQYNFLATLETFVGAAARAVQLHFDFDQVQAQNASAAANRVKALGELEGVHRAAVRALHDAAARSSEPSALDYARQVEEHANRIVEGHRASAEMAGEREQASARGESERRRGEMRSAVESFLIAGRLQAVETRVTMRLVNGRNEMSALFLNADGIVSSFTLAASQVATWAAPRKVSDFAHGVDLSVGVKKSLFKRTVQPEVVHLDDYTIGGFELADDTCELRLRRKADQTDTLIFKLQRLDTELVAEVFRAGEDGASHVDAQDRAQLERLWQLLRAGAAEALARKERLLSISIDGQDVFEHQLVMPFIQRLVTQLAPTVAEIGKRSPNAEELSLKHEDDSGRREEIYVRKQDLVAKLEPLSREARAVFAPLGLSLRDGEGFDIKVDG